MILFPAIDLKGGHCVRLLKGDMNESTVFNTSPVDQATIFQSAGHANGQDVVDLDGAIAGHSINNEAILSIIRGRRVSNPIRRWHKRFAKRGILDQRRCFSRYSWDCSYERP